MQTLTNYIEAKQNLLFNEVGAFFAFSNKQFLEKKKENVVYVSLQSGLICPKDKVSYFNTRFNDIYHEGVKQDVLENGASAIIRREYFNYETQITNDTTDLFDALSYYIKAFPLLFTADIIKAKSNQCFQECIDNDWF